MIEPNNIVSILPVGLSGLIPGDIIRVTPDQAPNFSASGYGEGYFRPYSGLLVFCVARFTVNPFSPFLPLKGQKLPYEYYVYVYPFQPKLPLGKNQESVSFNLIALNAHAKVRRMSNIFGLEKSSVPELGSVLMRSLPRKRMTINRLCARPGDNSIQVSSLRGFMAQYDIARQGFTDNGVKLAVPNASVDMRRDLKAEGMRCG